MGRFRVRRPAGATIARTKAEPDKGRTPPHSPTNRAWFAVVFGALLTLELLELRAPDPVLAAPCVLGLTLQLACSELREHRRLLDFRQPVLVAVDEQLVRYRWCAHGVSSSWPVVVCGEDARPTREKLRASSPLVRQPVKGANPGVAFSSLSQEMRASVSAPFECGSDRVDGFWVAER